MRAFLISSAVQHGKSRLGASIDLDHGIAQPAA